MADPFPSTEWAAITLWRSLHALGQNLSGNADWFDRLSTLRERARQMRRTDPPTKVEESPDATEPMAASLLRILGRAQACHASARRALKAGGAQAIDEALAPGSKRESVEIGLLIEEAGRELSTAKLRIESPRCRMDESATAIRELGERLVSRAERCRVTLDQLGVKWSTCPPYDEGPMAVEMLPPLIQAAEVSPSGEDGDAIGQAVERAIQQAILALGGDQSESSPTPPSVRDLCTEAGISDDTFRRVRAAAGIEVSLKGAAARDRRYLPAEVDQLIQAALAGSFMERQGMAKKWAKWSTNPPQVSRK